MSSREFDVRQPNDNEEEKIILAAHHINDNGGVNNGEGGGTTAPSSYLQVIDEDEEEETVDVIPSAHDVHKTKATDRRQSSRGHFPPPSISKSPVVSGGRMKEHLKQNWGSFMSSSSSSSSQGKSSDSPTISYEGGSFDERNHYEQTKHEQQQHAMSPSSLVVCGVDGVVYTVDAFTGQLRGMFASGPALVQSSSPSEDTNSPKDDAFNEYSSDADDDVDGFSNVPLENEDDYDFDSAMITSNVVQGRKERVVPGLDGRLYSVEEFLDMDDWSCNDETTGGSCSNDDGNIIPRFGSITPLPISAMDVVDSPISTCQPGTSDADQRQCGIIVGSKKTTIYAIDPTTGKVRWQQDPFGKAGGRGYTTRPPKNAARGSTVLLQREDYAVRHLDTDGGNDVWKVELGRFSALDFDLDLGSQSGQQETSRQTEDDTMFDNEPAAGVGGRRRGAAAAAASLNDKKKSSVPPILGRKKTSLHDFESDFSDERHKENVFDDFDHDHSFRGFPSIAFGEDGTCLVAVDSISGEVLWKRRIESVVAAAYGVGKESNWVPLNVIDETEVHCSSMLNAQNVGLLPSPSSTLPSGGGLVPYGGLGDQQLHRLGRHHSNLFVSSKLDVGYDAHEIDKSEEDNLLYPSNSLDTPLPPRVSGLHPTSDTIFTISPQPSLSDVRPPQSHRTEHGVYLSWSMLAAVAMILLSIVVCLARYIILRQKRKYENTPSLDPTSAPSSSEDGRERSQSQSSGGIILPPSAAQNLSAPSAGMNIWTKKQPVVRSYSLGAISHSYSPPRSNNVAQPFISSRHGATLTLPETTATSAPITPRPSAVETKASPTTSPSLIARSKTLPTETLTSDDKTRQGADNIDGIPLVQYSRYTSEFTQGEPLGRGGFGTVFRVKNNLDEREYAIKKIKILSQISVDGKVTKRYSQKFHRVLREVKSLALLDHPNIVRYYTAWLEVDQNEDEDTIATGSMLDQKSPSIFSNSLFSGFGSKSRTMQTSFSPQRSIHQRPNKGKKSTGSYNPLGWNNFGSFRLDESKSQESPHVGEQQVLTSDNATLREGNEDEDSLGFNWERSKENTAEPSTSVVVDKQPLSELQKNTVKEESSESSSGISSIDSKDSTDSSTTTSHSVTQLGSDKKTVTLPEPVNKTDCEKTTTTEGRHILFIQMQLCSVQTLADFLSSREERSGSIQKSVSRKSSDYAVDIPLALRLFSQIALALKYVHKQGLIHRDLKPQNCFIDDIGNVKVGDFGLSRESSAAGVISEVDESGKDESDQDDSLLDNGDAENTAGVGTRAYASPEQMRGSNYDASTDVYSLGLMLFELCYPMYTNMERYTEFGNIRKGHFPTYWNYHVKTAFPTMHTLLVKMISDSPSQRPTAGAVSDHIESLLREYSVQSIDKSWGKKGALLLRVEAQEREGILAHTMKVIKEAAPHSTILQYGLRGQSSKAIMEFALEIKDNEKTASVKVISTRLNEHEMHVRRIMN